MCSKECRRGDYSQHKARCDDIVETIKMIDEKVIIVEGRGRSNVEKFVGPYGRDYFDLYLCMQWVKDRRVVGKITFFYGND